MLFQRILVPFNFTPYDHKTINFVKTNYVHHKYADITLLCLYTPVPEIDVLHNPVMEKLASSLSYLTHRKMELEKDIQVVVKGFVDEGFPEGRIHYIFTPKKKDVASEIIEVAKKKPFNTIILNHKAGKATYFFTGTVFNKVILALKDVTVCVVT